MLGPVTTDQDPEPVTGVLAASDTPPGLQTDCALPALAVVGGATTVIVTSEVDEVQGELEIVQRNR